MDFQEFQEAVAALQSRKWSRRQKRLDALDRALYGELYKHKTYPFSRELRDPNSPNSGRVLLNERRAAVQYREPWILVRDVVGRLWGENHRPNVIVRGEDAYTKAWISSFMRDSSFWLTLIEASWEGSVGSVAIVLRVLGASDEVKDETTGQVTRKPRGPGRFYAEIWPSKECKPVFRRDQPGELASLTRTYEVDADALTADGYDIAVLDQKWRTKKFGRSSRGVSWNQQRRQVKDGESWTLRVTLDDKAETWFEPVPTWLYERDDFADSDFELDKRRTFTHGLGETPAKWGRPIPFRHTTFPDGLCFFEPTIDYQFRIDRTLSQTGRAFDYAGDPQLAYVEAAGDGGSEFGESLGPDSASVTDVITVGAKGGAEFIEISGEALRIAIEIYVKTLVQLARTVGGGSQIDHESKTGTSLSGTAMKLLNAALDVLVGILRITLGEQFFVGALRLAMRMADKVEVGLPSLSIALEEAKKCGSKAKALDPEAVIELQWPDANPPTGQDLFYTVQAIKLAASAGTVSPPIISHETAIANAAPYFDVQAADQEQADIFVEAQMRATLAQSDSSASDPGATPKKKDETSNDDPKPANDPALAGTKPGG